MARYAKHSSYANLETKCISNCFISFSQDKRGFQEPKICVCMM